MTKQASDEVTQLESKVDELAQEIQRRTTVEDELRAELASLRAAERSTEQLVKLQALTSALSRRPGVVDVAAAAVQHLPSALGVAAGAILVVGAGGDTLELVSHAGLPTPRLVRSVSIHDGRAACLAVRTGEPQWMAGLAEIERRAPSTRAIIAEVGVDGVAALPLRIGDRVIGAMTLGFEGRGAFSEDERVFALTVADLCAQAIERALVYARMERAARWTARLQGVTAAFSEALTPREVADVAVTQGCAALGARRGLVGLLAEGGETLEVLRLVGYPDDFVAAWDRIPMSHAVPLTEVARSGTPQFIGTLAEGLARYPALASAYGPGEHAAAMVPLTVAGRTFGAMVFVFDEVRRFDGEERGDILALAHHCALALDRARLYETATRARADAEAAARAKDDFLSTISHEIRTPLTSIIGWAEILRTRTLAPDAAARALAVIGRSAKAQAQLIEDLLDVSRMATSKLRVAIRACDPAAVVRAAVDAIRPSAEAQGLTLEVLIDDIEVLEADPDRLQQIAVNLLANAVKFTPRGGRIEVRLDREAASVRLRVSDTGRGIEPSFLPHVFERFQQAESGNARPHGGLGLGLSIARHLVELHDGAITAASEGPGRGATFIVVLPCPSPGEPAADGPSADDRPSPEPPRLDGVRVLVVDDNLDTRELIAAVLREQGASVVLAASAAEAMRAVEDAPPDVLVSDIGMPDEDGYALLRRVRALSAVPALALTAYAGTHDARMAELAGFERYLAKPVTPARLTDAVARLARRVIKG